MTEWVGHTETEIAQVVQAGDVTAREVAAEHQDRIAAMDGELGAFVRVRAEAALGEAVEIDARPDRTDLPLAGVPVRSRTTCRSPRNRCAAARRPPRMLPQEKNHPVVARLRAAGAVIAGLANLPELG